MKKATLALALAIVSPTAFAHPDHSDPRMELGRIPVPAAVPDRAYGRAGVPSRASRTVAVEMRGEAQCAPASLNVKQGETVKFVARNSSNAPRELAIGTATELKDHGDMMRKFPQMSTSLARVRAHPGQGAELVWQFTQPGEFNLSCAGVGQYDAAALGKVVVAP